MERLGGRVLYAADPGLGKTRSSFFYAVRNDAFPCVVVCPAPLKFQWQREAAHHFGLRADVLSGVNPEPFGLAIPPIHIVNFEILGPSRYGPGWLEQLRGLKPQTVIIDECTAVKDPFAKRSRWVKSLCRGVPNVLALSGTPIEIRPMELWSILNILRPELYPNRMQFGFDWCSPRRAPWGWEFKGSTNPDALHKKLSEEVMIRRRKADVIKQLPRKVRTVVPLELSDRKEYEKATADFLKWLGKKEPGKLHGAARAAGMVKAGYLKRLAAELKLKAVGEWVDNWLETNDGKILLFAVHKKIVSWLHEKYKGRCVVVDGSVVGRKRQNAVDEFQKNPRTDIFIGNINAAGKGLNLTAASATAFLEFSWKPSDHTQAEHRGYARLGDLHGMQIFYFVALDSIEERIFKLLQTRQREANAIIDGNKSVGENLDLFDMLVKSIEEEKSCK